MRSCDVNHVYISIHAPARGATLSPVIVIVICIFQSTLPHGERQHHTKSLATAGISGYFPRTPFEGRPVTRSALVQSPRILAQLDARTSQEFYVSFRFALANLAVTIPLDHIPV